MDKEIPKVSFLYAVHLIDDYVYETLNSLLNQDYANFDIILVDDSARMMSLDDRYASDSRIKVVKNNKPLGLTASLNKGIMASSSDFIARVDRGNLCEPSRLSEQVRYLEENNLDICTCFVQEINEKGRKTKVFKPPQDFKKLVFALEKGNCIAHASILVKRECLLNLNLYDQRFKSAQDYDFYLRSIRAGYKIGTLAKALLQRKIFSNSTTLERRKLQILNSTTALVSHFANTQRVNLRSLTNICLHFSKIFIPQFLRKAKNK